MPGFLELGLGAAWFPDRDVTTLGSVDASLAGFPDPIVGVDVRGSAGIARPPPAGFVPLERIGDDAEGEPRVAVPWSAALTVQFAPLPATVVANGRAIEARPFVLAGPGVARTLDGFSVYTPVGEPDFRRTASQVHPTLVVGGGVRVGSGTWGLRLQGDSARWIEVVQATDLEIVDRISFSAALIRRPTAGR
jgi:hypothetical protein